MEWITAIRKCHLGEHFLHRKRSLLINIANNKEAESGIMVSSFICIPHFYSMNHVVTKKYDWYLQLLANFEKISYNHVKSSSGKSI